MVDESEGGQSYLGGVSKVRLVGVRTERQWEARYFRALKAIVRMVAFIGSLEIRRLAEANHGFKHFKRISG